MRLVDDDEVYEIDSSYLGPPGRYIAVMKHKVIFLWLVIGPVVGVTLRRMGMEITLLSAGLTVLGVTAVVLWLADRITYERPVGSLVGMLWHEVTAPRADRRRTTSTAADLSRVGGPRGSLRGWVDRRSAATASSDRS